MSKARRPSDPTMPPVEALAVLTKDLQKARQIRAPKVSARDYTAWASTTLGNLMIALGEHAPSTLEFAGMMGEVDAEYEGDEARGSCVDSAIALLESVIDNFNTRLAAGTRQSTPVKGPSILPREVFIVHGHDESLKHEVARFVSSLSLEPIILGERANLGATLIEKLERQGHTAGFAIVLLTPDDFGGAKGKESRPRARQNVILELGYFIGLLTRKHVCALYKGEIELPSDFVGVVYTPYGDNWKLTLAKELKEIWPDIDLNKL